MSAANSPKSYSVGQVIFVLSADAQKIIPAIVCEEMVVKKLDGQQITHKIAIGPKGKEKIIDSTKLNGEIYSSLDEIRVVLEKRLSAFLNSLIQEAEKRTLKWYGKSATAGENASSIADEEKIDPEQLMNSFDDVSSSPLPTTAPVNNIEAARHNLREELRRKMMEDDGSPQIKQEASVVELPDGRIVRVKDNRPK